MASSYDVINLSELAVPDAIVVPDAATIFLAGWHVFGHSIRRLMRWWSLTQRTNRARLMLIS